MTLRLHYHPLSSFCWKALIALYETGVPFEPVLVDFGNDAAREAFYALWPVGQFPVIEDTARDHFVPESSIIIEYLDRHYPGPARLVPADPDRARQARMHDRFFDLHVHQHMQKIVGDRIRPEGSKDPFGVGNAKQRMTTALGLVENTIGDSGWAMGEDFTMPDIAAAPALFYSDKIVPLAKDFPKTAAYLERLKARPSFARVLAEAEPYFKMFPGG
ncbi:MAG TPA: glutathione S-transferase family protein [Rhizomicrobium sp.]|jgi:glutathione S-transferase|nr:glutathione S-transferase family protein [Rhizomicrobium sp.]